jgi:hypothetical protein
MTNDDKMNAGRAAMASVHLDDNTVTFDGVTYTPIPIENQDGWKSISIPRPTDTVGLWGIKIVRGK